MQRTETGHVLKYDSCKARSGCERTALRFSRSGAQARIARKALSAVISYKTVIRTSAYSTHVVWQCAGEEVVKAEFSGGTDYMGLEGFYWEWGVEWCKRGWF